MGYGLSYQGSKQKIADKLLSVMPSAHTFYDLFAGGCSMTHAAMLTGKWKRFVINDIKPQVTKLFIDAINGGYRDERRCISKDQFDALKEDDAYVAICWSFGNNGKNYLWNEETEGAKLRACKMIMAETWQERRRLYMDFIKYLQDTKKRLEERKSKQSEYREKVGIIKEWMRNGLLAALKESGKTQAEVNKHLGTEMGRHYFGKSQWAFPTEKEYNKLKEILTTLPEYEYWGEGLESLQSLQSLESLQRFCGSYQDVPLSEDSVIYCDIPYVGTADYGNVFDHEEYYKWVREHDLLIFTSEYRMPDDFISIMEIGKRSSFSSSSNNTKTVERLFVHESKINMIRKTTLF